MDDRELLEEHALAQSRLRGALVYGTRWRERPVPATARRVLIGAVLAIVAAALVAAASFVSVQLGHPANRAQAVHRTTAHAQL